MKTTFPSTLLRPQPRAELSSLFNHGRQVGVTRSSSGYIPIYQPWTPERTHQQRMANLDAVTIHVTDNTIYDRHPLRRIYSRADITPRKARLERERRETHAAIKSVAFSVAGAIILAAGALAGFFLSSIN
jgi:hypothetical protein